MGASKVKPPLIFDLSAFKNITDLTGMLQQFADSLSTQTLKSTFQQISDYSAKGLQAMGAGSELSDNIRKNIAGSVEGIQKLGYTGQESMALAQSMMAEISVATGKNTQYNDALFGKLQTTAKVTGQTTKELTDSFTDAGYSLESVSEEMGKALDVARARGLNGVQVSKQMLDNMDAMDKFSFEGGIDGLTKMAAMAVQMRVGMESTLTLANKLLSPENAIETAAALQRLGVVQSDLLDPLRLMNLSQNNPTELLNQIGEMAKGFAQLNETTGKMEIMPGGREQLRAIASELGMTDKEIFKMAKSSAELQEKISSIKFPELATEEQKTLFTNLTHLNKMGDTVITVEGLDYSMDAYMETFTKNGQFDEKMLEQLTEANTPKTIEAIADDQLKELEKIKATLGTIGVSGALGRAVSSSTVNSSKMFQEAFQSIANIFKAGGGGSTRNVTRARDNVSENFIPTRESGELGRLPTTLPISILDMVGAGKQITEESTKLPEPFNIIINKLGLKFQLLGESVDTVIKKFLIKDNEEAKDFISTKDGTFDIFPEDTIFGGTGGENIANMIKGGVSTMSSGLMDPMRLMDLSQSKNLNPMSNGMETIPNIKDFGNGDLIQMLSSIGVSTEKLENISKKSETNNSSKENKVVIEVRVDTSNNNINPDLNQKIVEVVTQAFKDDTGLKQVVATNIKDVVNEGGRIS